MSHPSRSAEEVRAIQAQLQRLADNPALRHAARGRRLSIGDLPFADSRRTVRTEASPRTPYRSWRRTPSGLGL
jgi:hypothetical protein